MSIGPGHHCRLKSSLDPRKRKRIHVSDLTGDPLDYLIRAFARWAFSRKMHFHTYAQVAQSVEQRTENPRVGGSIPPLGTNFPQYETS